MAWFPLSSRQVISYSIMNPFYVLKTKSNGSSRTNMLHWMTSGEDHGVLAGRWTSSSFRMTHGSRKVNIAWTKKAKGLLQRIPNSRWNRRTATAPEFVDWRLKSTFIPSHGLRFGYLYHTSGFSVLNLVAKVSENWSSQNHCWSGVIDLQMDVSSSRPRWFWQGAIPLSYNPG